MNCIDKSDEYLKLKRDTSNKFFYQIKLVNDIKTRLLDSKKTAGILVLPTGGGKTRVAVTSALDVALKEDYKILWIAHRHMLLEQAAKTFCEFSNIADRKINIRTISGKHDDIVSIDKKDDVIIISNLSMGVREKTDLKAKATLKERVFTKDQKWLIIVDEAHHSLAKSYKEWIGIETHGKKGWLREHRENKIKILGLTATPNFIVEDRSTDYDINRTKELSSLFDDNMIGAISTKKLIDDEILSRPNFITINTGINFDADKLLSKVENIKPSLKNSLLEKSLNVKIAKYEKRNQIIVNTYLNGYDKIDFTKSQTLIFASNIINARVLKEAFKNKGVEVDVIDSQNFNNDEIIDKFRKGEIKVLINVQILTEGSDIPEIENIFIPRITSSKVLYRQMVGRALRGVDSGGTKTANIVTFRDNILNHQKDFFDLQKLNSGLFDEQEISEYETDSNDNVLISEDYIAKVYEKFLNLDDIVGDIPLIAAIPIGYYNLEETDSKIQVYEHQIESYKNFITAYINDNDILDINIEKLESLYFKKTNMLFNIDSDDIKEFIAYLKEIEVVPTFITFTFKNNLIQELRDIASKSTDIQVWEEYYHKSEYAKCFYSIEDYIEECSRIYRSLRYGLKPLKTVEIENDIPLSYQFDDTAHDKNKLFESASKKICKVLGKDKLEFSPNGFEWSKKAYKSYWGMATGSTDGMSRRSDKNGYTSIVVNKLLQLKGLNNEIIEFVVYHELLHTEMQNYTHDDSFKKMEAKFPNYAYCEHMLFKLADANIENIDECLNKYEKTNNSRDYSWKIYDKNNKSKREIKKYINKKSVKLPSLKEMKKLYNNEKFRKDLLKDEKLWFLCNDQKTTFCFGDGSSAKISWFNFENSNNQFFKNLNLLIKEES